MFDIFLIFYCLLLAKWQCSWRVRICAAASFGARDSLLSEPVVSFFTKAYPHVWLAEFSEKSPFFTTSMNVDLLIFLWFVFSSTLNVRKMIEWLSCFIFCASDVVLEGIKPMPIPNLVFEDHWRVSAVTRDMRHADVRVFHTSWPSVCLKACFLAMLDKTSVSMRLGRRVRWTT